MKIRKVEDNDILELSTWFEDISWDLPPVDGAIPRDGYVAEKDGVIVACAWLYLTGSACSFVQWTNTNPKVDEKDQSEGLSLILKTFQEMAPHIVPQIKTIVTYTRSDKFREKLRGLGFRSSGGFYQCTWVSKKNAVKEV